MGQKLAKWTAQIPIIEYVKIEEIVVVDIERKTIWYYMVLYGTITTITSVLTIFES